jgi:hypothetical protein
LAAPLPVNASLAPERIDDARFEALTGGQTMRPTDVVVFGKSAVVANDSGGAELAVGIPGEIWLKFDEPKGRISGAVRTGKSMGKGAVKISVVYYKSGRFDNRHDVILQYGDEAGEIGTFDVGIPESTGSIGLIATPVAGEAFLSEVRWSQVILR